jgi:hypothetical protein
MNETPPIQTPPVKKKAKKTSTPRTPRIVDPRVAEIRAETAARVKEYLKTKGSAAKLIVILKRLENLTAEDRQKLMDALLF